MGERDWDDDDLDGVLFRFWIRAASFQNGWPSEVAKALTHCGTPAEYRKALVGLAKQKGVNLPTTRPAKENEGHG